MKFWRFSTRYRLGIDLGDCLSLTCLDVMLGKGSSWQYLRLLLLACAILHASLPCSCLVPYAWLMSLAGEQPKRQAANKPVEPRGRSLHRRRRCDAVTDKWRGFRASGNWSGVVSRCMHMRGAKVWCSVQRGHGLLGGRRAVPVIVMWYGCVLTRNLALTARARCLNSGNGGDCRGA
jgi:hypothetical protein